MSELVLCPKLKSCKSDFLFGAHHHMADAAFASRGLCSVCDLMFSVTAALLVRKHGPVNCRCAASNMLPKLPEQPLATPHSHAMTDPAGEKPMSDPHAVVQDSSQHYLLPSKCSVQMLKWIPSGSRGHAGKACLNPQYCGE